MRGRERKHPVADDVPGVDPLRGRVTAQEADGVLREVGREHERESGAQEPDRRASTAGHQQEPEERGHEHDVEHRIGGEHRALEQVAVVHETGVDDQELPDREARGDRDRDTVDEPVTPSLRRADHHEQQDRAGDQRVREEIEAVGGRHEGSPAAEQRVDLPDRGAHDDHRHRKCQHGPGLPSPARGHQSPKGERARRTGARCHRRDGGRLRPWRDHHNRGESQRRQREPPRTGARQGYHETSSASRCARSSLKRLTERSWAE